jgi:vesicle transport through interaction with t-SNAREs protein 1
VSQLEVEIQGIPQSIKIPYLTRLRQAKSDLTKYKKLSKDLHARVNLLGGAKAASFRSDDPYADERTNRERLLAGTESLSDGSQRLANTHRTALEAEDIGVDILRSLRSQRETIENTRDTVSLHAGVRPSHWLVVFMICSQLHTADTNIDRADSTVKKMVRQYVCFCLLALVTPKPPFFSLPRMYKQRVMLGGIAVFFVALILTILYFKLLRHS